MKKHGRAWRYTGHQSLDQQMQSPARCRGGREAKGEVFSFVETSHMNLFLKYTNLLKEPKDWQELRFTQPP